MQNQTEPGQMGIARLIVAMLDSGRTGGIVRMIGALRELEASEDMICVEVLDQIRDNPHLASYGPPPDVVECLVCEDPIINGQGTGHRSDRIYCSAKCRQKRLRQKKRAA